MTRSLSDISPGTFFDPETWFVDEEQSIACVTLKGHGHLVRNDFSDATYEIVSGKGVFTWHDGETIFGVVVGTGDILDIPKGTTYQDVGDLVMLVTCEPPFDPTKVEIIR